MSAVAIPSLRVISSLPEHTILSLCARETLFYEPELGKLPEGDGEDLEQKERKKSQEKQVQISLARWASL